MKKIYIDFESYYNTEIGYTLREMSMTEYIRDPRFKVLGCGYYIKGDDGIWEYGWVRGENMEDFKQLDWANLIMVAHNVKFDGAIFAWKYGIRPAMYFDTQSLARAVIGQNLSSHSLKSVSSYLGLPPKGELKSDGLLTLDSHQEQEMMEYNLRDLECCAGIDEKIGSQFPEGQLWSMDWTVRAFINAKMVLDTAILDNMVHKEHERKSAIFQKLGIEMENFTSSKKFAALLEERKIEVPTKISPKGKTIPAFALSDSGFMALKKTCPDLYEARVAAKSTITETRGLALAEISRTGPFPFDVQFSGAIGTHRYSGGSGGGGNPQNFPNKGEMRKSVIAPPGFKLGIRDFSAIEARLVAWTAKEPELISVFLANGDPYSAFAEKIYGHPVNKQDHPQERKVGKTCILGLGYQMGAEKFQFTLKRDTGIDMPIEQCYKVVNTYRDTYNNIQQLWENASNIIPQIHSGYTNYVPFAPFIRIEHNALVLPSGLRIQYPNLRQIEVPYVTKTGQQKIRPEWVYDVYKRKYDAEPTKLYGGKVVENICQAIAGEICKIAIQRCEENEVECYGQIHDEIIAVVRDTPSDSRRAMDVMRVAMETPINWWPDLRLSSEGKICDNWAQGKG